MLHQGGVILNQIPQSLIGLRKPHYYECDEVVEIKEYEKIQAIDFLKKYWRQKE